MKRLATTRSDISHNIDNEDTLIAAEIGDTRHVETLADATEDAGMY